MRFDTSDFFNAHGKQPRGTGLWFFQVEGTEFTHNGSYTEAKKACRKAHPKAMVVKVQG